MLAIPDEVVHASHFYTRSLDSDERRPVDKYLDRLREIRRLQRYIVERANRADVPVVSEDDTDAAVAAVMELVVSAAERAQQAGAA